MRSENIHQLYNNRKKSARSTRFYRDAVTVLEAPCPTPLVSSICLLRPLAVKGPARSSTAVTLSVRFFFFSLHLPVPLLLPSFLSLPLPLDRISWWLPLFASLGRSSSRFVTLFFIVERDQRLSRIDVITYGNSRGRGFGGRRGGI